MKHITVVFKNAIQIEGHLLSLKDNEMVLQSLDNMSSTIIPDIKENVLFYKVNSSQEVYDEIVNKPNRSEEDLEKIAQAKGNLNAIERASIREKITAPIMPIQKEVYVSRNQPFPRSVQYSEKKTTGSDTPFASGLQRMFAKKH